MSSLLSIVIVAYKSRDEIYACLESLPGRINEGEVEVVVVDNSPGDGTGLIVQTRFPDVIYVAPEKNLGFGRANNLGYARTNPASEFVLFLNPDTVCNEAALAHCVARLSADRSIGLISSKLMMGDGSMDLACRRSIPTLWDGFCRASGLAAAFPGSRLFSGYNLTHLPDTGTYEVGAINGAFMMGRRVVFDSVGAEGLEFRAQNSGKIAVRSLSNPTSLERQTVSSREGADTANRSSTISGQPSVYSFPPGASSAPHVFDESFFMYGDDLDLCIRVAKGGYKIIYDGSVSVVHLKGLSVAKDYEPMSQAIFDANRDVYLKHFNPRGSRLVRLKYVLAFATWKRVARLRARLRKTRQVKPA